MKGEKTPSRVQGNVPSFPTSFKLQVYRYLKVHYYTSPVYYMTNAWSRSRAAKR